MFHKWVVVSSVRKVIELAGALRHRNGLACWLVAMMLAGCAIGRAGAVRADVVINSYPATDFGITTSADNVEVQGIAATTTTGNSSGNNLVVATGTGANFKVGQAITGTGIPANSYVVSISADTLTLGGLGLTWQNGGFSPALNVPSGTTITPYNQVSAQPTADVNNLTLTGPGSAVTLGTGASLSIYGTLSRTGGETAIGSISGGTGIKAGTLDADLTISTPVASDGLIISSPILANGTGGLIKTGAGQLTLFSASDTANTYTGKTVVDGGTLVVFRNNGNNPGPNLGTVPTSFQADNITLKNGATIAWNNNLSRLKALTFEANRGIYLDTGMQTIERVGDLSIAINGSISGPGGLIVKYDSYPDAGGGANFDLNAANTYSGDTTFAIVAGQNKGWNFRVNHSLAMQNSTLDYSNAGNVANTVMAPSFGVATATLGGLKGGVIAGSVRTFVLPTTSLSVGNNSQDTIYSGTMSGTGKLIKIGTGKLTLNSTGANTYTGGVSVDNGTLELVTASQAGTGNITLNGGALLLGSGTAIQNNPLGSNGSGTFSSPNSSALTIGGLFNSNAVAMPSNITALTLNVASGTQTYSADLADGAVGMTVTKIGGGAQMLGSASYTGVPTNVNAGALSFAKQTSVRSDIANFVPANFIVASGAALGIGVGDSASGYFDSAAIDTVLDASHLGNSDASTGLKPGAQIGLDTTNAGGTFTRSTPIGDLVGGNSIGLAKLGAGTLVLDAANTYTGVTTVYAGTLQAGVGRITPFGPATSASLAFSAGSTGTVQLNGNSMTIVGLNTNATTVGTPIVENGVAGTATLTVDNSTASTYAGKLQNGSVGTLALRKTGAGTLTLSGTANTYTGKTVIDGGTLAFYSEGSLGTTPGAAQADHITINNGATLAEMAGPGNQTISANRGITLGSGVQTIRHNGNGWFRIDGVISGVGGLDVRSDGGNDLRLGGTNTYTGDTRLYANLGMSIARCLEGTTLDYNNYGGQLNYLTSSGFTAVTFGGLKGAQSLTFGTVALSIGNNNFDTAYSGELSSTGGGLTKIGTGTLTLSRSAGNSYTGGTIINGGTLLVTNTSGSGTGSGTVNVNANGTLGGTGQINGTVTVQNGAHLAPGDGIGTLKIANSLSLADGAILDFTLDSTSDLIDLVTNLSLGATKTLNVAPDSVVVPGTAYPLVHYSGSLSGSYNTGWTVTGAGAYAPTFTLTGSGTDQYLNVSFAVPYHHSTWTGTGGGNWDSGNWDNGVPNANTDTATFDSSHLTGDAEVALGAVRTVKSLTLDNATYQVTLSGTTEQTLKLQDADTLATVPVNVLAGSHLISAPVNLVNDVQVNTSAGAALEIAGKVTGSPLTKAGDGTLTLSGTGNDYEATIVTGGTLIIASAGALPTGKSLSIGSGGTLILGGGMAMGTAASAEPVPEPGTLALLAIAALAGIFVWRRRN